jgi:hypothetical protein
MKKKSIQMGVLETTTEKTLEKSEERSEALFLHNSKRAEIDRFNSDFELLVVDRM